MYLVFCGQIRARLHQDPHYVNAPLLDGEVEDFIQASLAHKVKGGGDQVIEDIE